ncbi:MAG: PAS domain S-box protein [Thermodesulfovibrio sp.]|nr:PAS domain S-box protein [Thermodesulfovibrio sp.]
MKIKIKNRIFEEILDKVCDCVIIIDEACKIVFWSKRCEELFEYKLEQIIGIDINRILSFPEDIECSDKVFDILINSEKSKSIGKNFYVICHGKDGKKIKATFSLYQINIEKEKYYVAKLRKSEDLVITHTGLEPLVDKILDLIPLPIFVKDKNLKYTYVNKAFEDFTGISKKDAIGKTVFELYPHEIAKVYNEQDLMILEKTEKQIYSFKMITKDGSLREVEFHKASFSDSEGKVSGILGIYFDIQERNDLIRRLESEKQKTEKAYQVMSRFLSMMGHELLTPLSNILGYTNLLLLSSDLKEVYIDYLKNIKNMCESLMSIITDLLEISKLENYTLKLNPEETNLPELIFDVVDHLKYECYLKGLEFYLYISPILPEKVIVDKLRLKQILINLISNAIKYTEKGFIEFGIICDRTNMPPNKAKVQFNVSDTGIGISEDKIDKIFLPFYRVEENLTERKFGVGLGLFLTKRLLQLMGSDIKVKSKLGKGSKFSFELIFDIVEDTSEQNFEKLLGKKALLIFELDKRFVSMMNYLLYWGVEAIIPSNERDFLELINKYEHFDFLILDSDIKSIEIDKFFDIIIDFKNRGKINKVVVIYKPIENIQQIVDRFFKIADTYLQKPINTRRLMKALEERESEVRGIKETDIILSYEPFKILVVDDLETNRKLLKYLIQKTLPNAEIFESENGETAIILHKNINPHITFMDIQMPKMDGYETTRLIKKSNEKAIIVALSAHTNGEEKKKAISEGFNFFLSKPIKLSDLRHIVKEVLSNKIEEKTEQISRIDYKMFEENQLSREFVSNLLRLSIETLPFYIEEIKNHYINGDFERLKKAAHKLKGSSYSSGLIMVGKIADLINKQKEFNKEHLRSLIENLITEWKETEKEIREFLNLSI